MLTTNLQVSTDDFAGWLALHTNLALKGIIGIKAMSELAHVMDHHDDARFYKVTDSVEFYTPRLTEQNISHTYIHRWTELAMSRDGSHAQLAYDWYGSWTTLYSLYADAVLCFHPSLTNSSSLLELGQTPIDELTVPPLERGQDQAPLQAIDMGVGSAPLTSSQSGHDFIPHDIYLAQSRWYGLVMQKYGLPLDSRHRYAKSDWEFAAAAVAEPDLRADLLDRVARWLNETSTDRPFTDLYETEGDGGFPGPHFFARPVVGGHFAFLALERACMS